MGEIIGCVLLIALIAIVSATVSYCICQDKIDRLKEENRVLRTSLNGFLRLKSLDKAAQQAMLRQHTSARRVTKK